LPEFHFPQAGGFYVYPRDPDEGAAPRPTVLSKANVTAGERFLFGLMKNLHNAFFSDRSSLSPSLRWIASRLDSPLGDRLLLGLMEDPLKRLLLNCQCCGDCAIQHVGYLCPESQCPKHMRNGPCGGSSDGRCEVNPEKACVWVRAYRRLARHDEQDRLVAGFIPPRMWELNKTSAWLNYHLGRDHTNSENEIARFCNAVSCRLPQVREANS
jgi:methylenetetrahydrofolate reductase (NADPH)